MNEQEFGLNPVDLNELINETKPNLNNDDISNIIIENKKKKIIEEIKNLNIFEHQEIFKIIKKENIKFSENSNGVFINMNKLSDKIIFEIDKFISYCNMNKTKFNDENKLRVDLKKFVENKISQEKKEDNLCVLQTNKDEDTIEKGISYTESNEDEDNLEDIEDVDCSKNNQEKENLILRDTIDKTIMNDLKII